MQHRAYIALGSNLNDPLLQLIQAIDTLSQMEPSQLTAISRFYITKPFGTVPQGDFLNAVVELSTSIPPLQLLNNLQAIEKAQLRERSIRWGPRTLDLDILLYGDQQIDHPRLQIPHPGLRERSFVLAPLMDLNPELTLPDGDTLNSLFNQVDKSDIFAIDMHIYSF